VAGLCGGENPHSINWILFMTVLMEDNIPCISFAGGPRLIRGVKEIEI
jgi:hypothetical protein